MMGSNMPNNMNNMTGNNMPSNLTGNINMANGGIRGGIGSADVVVNGANGGQQVRIGTDTMEIKVLGAGKEVGRSCCLVKFKGKCIMFDCGEDD